MEDLYKKYLRNIKNGKTAIKKEYVDRGYFSYYSKKDIYNFSNSKKIVIDGVDSYYQEFVYDVLNKIKDNKPLDFKTIYLGKVGPKLNKMIHQTNKYELNIEDYNLSISDFDIQHIYNKHHSRKEHQRGQRPILKKDIEIIPFAIANTNEIEFIGKNKKGLSLYKFVSYNKDGTFNLIEFIGYSKKQLGLKTIYINLKNTKKGSFPGKRCYFTPLFTSETAMGTEPINNISYKLNRIFSNRLIKLYIA